MRSAQQRLRSEDPVEADQTLAQRRVGGDQLRSSALSECNVEQVGDGAVVVPARETPRSIEVPGDAGEKRVGDLLDRGPGPRE